VEEADVDRTGRGWDSAGALVSLRPGAPSLVGVKLHAGGGPVDVRVAPGQLAGVVSTRTGADEAEAGDEVVVDLRFEPQPLGTVLAGVVESVGDAPFQILAVVDDGDPGIWGLSAEGCEAVAAALARGEVASVLAQARSNPRP
jgi:hypothetical protein